MSDEVMGPCWGPWRGWFRPSRLFCCPASSLAYPQARLTDRRRPSLGLLLPSLVVGRVATHAGSSVLPWFAAECVLPWPATVIAPFVAKSSGPVLIRLRLLHRVYPTEHFIDRDGS